MRGNPAENTDMNPWKRTLFLAFAGVCICILFGQGCSDANYVLPLPGSDTVRVRRAVFVDGVEDIGVIKAVRCASVMVETDGEIARMVPEGTLVKKGEPVLWIDDQDIQKSINSEKINLKQSQSSLTRAQESLSESQFNLQQTLKERTAIHQFDVLNVQRARRELTRLQDRFDRQLIPEAEVESAVDKLAQLELKENSSKLSLTRASAEYDSKLTNMKTELAIAEQEFERSQFRMAQLQNRLEKMVVKASADGIVVIQRNWRKEEFKVGDRVWSGVQVMEIPDLSEFQVWTQVPEVHFQRISEQQPVVIRIPALENLQLQGAVQDISWLAMPRVQSRGTGYTSDDSNDGGQVFEVRVALDNSDERLKTGMNVSVVFVEEQIADSLIIPSSAVAMDAEGPYVFLSNHDSFKFKRIETGISNRIETVVTRGLNEGDKVALFNPGRGV